MPVVGQTRVIPQLLEEQYQQLKAAIDPRAKLVGHHVYQAAWHDNHFAYRF